MDLARFFQEKEDTVQWLLHVKDAHAKQQVRHVQRSAIVRCVSSRTYCAINQCRPSLLLLTCIWQVSAHAAAGFSLDLLAFIELDVLKAVHEDFKVIAKRLDNAKLQIEAIKKTFDARLASKAGEEQSQLNDAVSWMTRITIIVMPMNLIAGFFGMNVAVPWQSEAAITWCMTETFASALHIHSHHLLHRLASVMNPLESP